MRKLFVILAVLMLLVCMAVPAFAIGSGSHQESTYFYPVLSFDSIRYESGSYKYTMPYPFDSQVKTDSDAEFEYGFDSGDLAYGACREFWVGSTPYIQGELSSTLWSKPIGTSATIQLIGRNQFVDLDLLLDNGFAIWFKPANLSVERVTIEIRAHDVYCPDGSSYYKNSIRGFDYSLSASGASVDFDPAFAHFKEKLGGNIVFLEFVKVDITFSRKDVATASLTFESKMMQNYTGGSLSYFSEWLAQEEVERKVTFSTVDNGNGFNWLMDSAFAFLDFELIPGFSIGKVFIAVLAVGLLLWFCKIIG